MDAINPTDEVVRLTQISKSFIDQSGKFTPVIDKIDMSINAGEVIAIIGPNGCGKSTLLKMVANLIPISGGNISFPGQSQDDIKYGFIFQNYAESLLPWFTNLNNIALSLAPGLKKNKKTRIIKEFVSSLGLENAFQLSKYPYESSSGQQQLVVLVRELLFGPSLLLMDEPFAALDLERKLKQQLNLIKIWEKTNPTVLLVSHDIEEAIFLADRVILLSKRPAVIAGTYDVNLPKPRTIDLLDSEELRLLKKNILAKFKQIINA